jgi:hypothetical protein
MIVRRLVIVMLIVLLRESRPCEADDSIWKIKVDDSTPAVLTGRIIFEIPGSAVLLEERNGKLHQISAKQITSRDDAETLFAPLTSSELAIDLLSQVPGEFEITETEHYVLCSNSAAEYVEFCGKLLESVFDQYFRIMGELRVAVHEPARKLPIVIFANASDFQAFAKKQHPEISFEDTPGYFSVPDNQTLLLDLTGDRSIRLATSIRKRLAEKPLQVATVVHEAVHQLAFNSGLQVRMADNPLWLSEGLAMYFESGVSRSSLLLSRPGLVNPRHHPAFMQLVRDNRITGDLNSLIESDTAFQSIEEMPTAYAKAWALTHYLFRQEKKGMQKYLQGIALRKPMVGLRVEQRTQEFQDAFGKLPDEMEREIVSYMKRQRVPR